MFLYALSRVWKGLFYDDGGKKKNVSFMVLKINFFAFCLFVHQITVHIFCFLM